MRPQARCVYGLARDLRALLPRRTALARLRRVHTSTKASRQFRDDDSIARIDAKWLARWESQPRTFRSLDSSSKTPYYVLSMFPYPSGSLHMGHLRVYTISDVVARYKYMKGFDVLHPMGWDSFGLPAENAAIERGVDPVEWTDRNIESMKAQLKRMGARFDWSRELRTSHSDFYAGTQRLFLKLFKEGLAYRAPALVNWDPVDQTVLANEQVSPEGISWRSGAKVEEKFLEQWFFKITDFAPKLLLDLDKLRDRWPDSVIAQQRNWIGESHGNRVTFPIRISGEDGSFQDDKIKVYTTRLDTILGVQFLALSVTHKLVKSLMQTNADLKNFVENVLPTLPAGTKAGFLLPNVTATNPMDRETGEDGVERRSDRYDLPVFVAPYVLGGMGTSAVMGVPAHDLRDSDFWHENGSGEPIKYVISKKGTTDTTPPRTYSGRIPRTPRPGQGVLNENCGKYSGLTCLEAHRRFYSILREEKLIIGSNRFKMRDWLISRQRFWGTPIPITHCGSCGPVAVRDEDLPVILPKVELTGRGGSPLKQAENGEWVKTSCPQCGSPAERDTDTMDTFVDSSWYFMKFGEESDPERSVMPVDIYIGGVEHAILHLLYARFISKYFAKANNDDRYDEPFTRLIAQGMVHGRTLSDPETGRFLKPDEVEEDSKHPVVKETGAPCNITYEKMSKSKFNGVDPTECLEKYGLDATRAHILFQAPVSDILDWNEEKIVGMQRWISKVRNLSEKAASLVEYTRVTGNTSRMPLPSDKTGADLNHEIRIAIQGVTASMEDVYSLNTAVSDLTILTNYLHGIQPEEVGPEMFIIAVETLLKLMSPICPAVSAECWEGINGPRNLLEEQAWPKDSDFAPQRPAFAQINIQINGKYKFTLHEQPLDWASDHNGDPRDWIVQNVFSTDDGYRLLQGRQIKNVIIVQSKNLVNILTR